METHNPSTTSTDANMDVSTGARSAYPAHGRLSRKSRMSRLPRDLEGKRRYLAQLMPNLTTRSLVRSLDILLADDRFVLANCQPHPDTRRPHSGSCEINRFRGEQSKCCAELAALAVGEALSLVEDRSAPLPLLGDPVVVRELTVLCTWVRMQGQFERLRLLQAGPKDLYYWSGLTTENLPSDHELLVGQLQLMLCDLAISAPPYAHALAQALQIDPVLVGLNPRWRFGKSDFLAVMHILVWSLQACDRIKRRYIHRANA